jgi:eukaryotic-like serine/threonine-protein kinase
MDTKAADRLLGTLINGRYRIRARVASGGMATVYTATDERLERTVALKIIHPAHAEDPHFLDRFADEAKTIARLTHPNVVAVYDQGVFEGLPYLVMEYVRGRTLRALLSDRRRLGAQESLAILEQMLAAIGAAHRAGLVHRDVKPENVLVSEPPGGGSLIDAVVKVADFGLARAVEASAEDPGGRLMATAAYVAPELVTDNRADPRTDVYAAGIVLFEMLTGRVPYDGDRPSEIAWRHVDQDVPPPSKYVAGLPTALDDLVARATRRDPAGRPTDAAALLAEVQAAREDILAATAGARHAAAPTVAVPVSPSAAPTSQLAIMPQQRPSWARLPEAQPPRGLDRRRGDGHYRSSNGLRNKYGVLVAGARQRPVLVAVMAVLVLLLAAGGWWIGFGRFTAAPSLLHLSQQEATRIAGQHGFKVRTDAGQYEEKIAKGTVVRQSPDGDQRIVRGGTITLTLSLGPERYTIPDESGRNYDDAAADLTSKKLIPKRVDTYDDNMPAGNVLSTDPAPGTVVPPHTEVSVKVSKGKAPITVPNVIGQDAGAAQQQLKALGLNVAFQQQQSDKPNNQVINQNIPDGAGVEKGATIILTISTGPPMVAVPDLSNKGYTFDQANQLLQQVGLVGVPVTPNLPGEQVRAQNPGPGTQVPSGSQVQLWILP